MKLTDVQLRIGTQATPKLAAFADHLSGRKASTSIAGCEGVKLGDVVLASPGYAEPFFALVETADGWQAVDTLPRYEPTVLALMPVMVRVPDPERDAARLRRQTRAQQQAAAAEEHRRQQAALIAQRQREWARYVRETQDAWAAQWIGHEAEA